MFLSPRCWQPSWLGEAYKVADYVIHQFCLVFKGNWFQVPQGHIGHHTGHCLQGLGVVLTSVWFKNQY